VVLGALAAAAVLATIMMGGTVAVGQLLGHPSESAILPGNPCGGCLTQPSYDNISGLLAAVYLRACFDDNRPGWFWSGG